jgi:hypothetical protein
MILSDVSIKRPVFAMVVSLMLMVLGLASLMQLPMGRRQLRRLIPHLQSQHVQMQLAKASSPCRFSNVPISHLRHQRCPLQHQVQASMLPQRYLLLTQTKPEGLITMSMEKTALLQRQECQMGRLLMIYVRSLLLLL